jgi:hypothetical protein
MIKLPPTEFWDKFKKTTGAFSTAEALALFNIVSDIKYDGVGDWVETYLELGSHKGKSSRVIAAAIKPSACLYCVEPEFSDEKWLNEFWTAITSKATIKAVADYSLNVIPNFDKLTFVFVDSGTHSDDLVMNECKMLEDRIIRNGVISFHDKGSQFTKVDEAYNYLVSTGKYEIVPIAWDEIFQYVKWQDLEAENNSWHQYPELPHPPNFIGALRRK